MTDGTDGLRDRFYGSALPGELPRFLMVPKKRLEAFCYVSERGALCCLSDDAQGLIQIPECRDDRVSCKSSAESLKCIVFTLGKFRVQTVIRLFQFGVWLRAALESADRRRRQRRCGVCQCLALL